MARDVALVTDIAEPLAPLRSAESLARRRLARPRRSSSTSTKPIFASTARARTPSFFLARFFVRKLLFLGDWHVDLRPLKCRTADVLRAARTLRQQAIRQQVVRLNAGRSDGWSGTL